MGCRIRIEKTETFLEQIVCVAATFGAVIRP
jgi:hypothetical protein